MIEHFSRPRSRLEYFGFEEYDGGIPSRVGRQIPAKIEPPKKVLDANAALAEKFKPAKSELLNGTTAPATGSRDVADDASATRSHHRPTDGGGGNAGYLGRPQTQQQYNSTYKYTRSKFGDSTMIAEYNY